MLQYAELRATSFAFFEVRNHSAHDIGDFLDAVIEIIVITSTMPCGLVPIRSEITVWDWMRDLQCPTEHYALCTSTEMRPTI
jgi:hypothetical protein